MGNKHLWTAAAPPQLLCRYPLYLWHEDETCSASLLQKLDIDNITTVLHTRRLRWYGYVLCASFCIESVADFLIPGTRKQTKLRKMHSECVKNDVNNCGLVGIDPWHGCRHSLAQPTPLNGTHANLNMNVDGYVLHLFPNGSGVIWVCISYAYKVTVTVSQWMIAPVILVAIWSTGNGTAIYPSQLCIACRKRQYIEPVAMESDLLMYGISFPVEGIICCRMTSMIAVLGKCKDINANSWQFSTLAIYCLQDEDQNFVADTNLLSWNDMVEFGVLERFRGHDCANLKKYCKILRSMAIYCFLSEEQNFCSRYNSFIT